MPMPCARCAPRTVRSGCSPARCRWPDRPGNVGRALLGAVGRCAAAFRRRIEDRASSRSALRALASSRSMVLNNARLDPATRSMRSLPTAPKRSISTVRQRTSAPRSAARPDRRLQRQRCGRRALSGMAGDGHPRGHPEQTRPAAATGRATERSATPRNTAACSATKPPWARPAGHPDTAVAARHRRRADRHRRRNVGHAGMAVQSFRRQRAVLGTASPKRGARLYRARTARTISAAPSRAQAGILARETAPSLSLADVDIESLVPEALRQVSRDEFFSRLQKLDAPMQARWTRPRAGRSLRYLAQLDADGGARVGLAMPEPGHASFIAGSPTIDPVPHPALCGQPAGGAGPAPAPT